MDITEKIENIIKEPIHSRKFYTDDNVITLKIKLEQLEEMDIINHKKIKLLWYV